MRKPYREPWYIKHLGPVCWTLAAVGIAEFIWLNWFS